jgi:hypothetical protein
VSTCVTGKGPDRLLQEGGGRGGGLVVLHGQVHPARAAVDGHRQGALRRDAVAVAQLGQVLHVQVHKADLVLLEGAVPCAGAISGRQAVKAFGPEDAVNRVAVQVGQEGGDHRGRRAESPWRGGARRPWPALPCSPSRAACEGEPSGPGSRGDPACATCGWSRRTPCSAGRALRNCRGSGRSRHARPAWCGRRDGWKASAPPCRAGHAQALQAPGLLLKRPTNLIPTTSRHQTPRRSRSR